MIRFERYCILSEQMIYRQCAAVNTSSIVGSVNPSIVVNAAIVSVPACMAAMQCRHLLLALAVPGLSIRREKIECVNNTL